MDHQRKSIRRKGFTILEIIVVVGILAVLAAIAVVGIGKILDSQRHSQTRTVLSSAQSMLVEFDRETALKRQPPHMWSPTNTVVTAGLDFWRDADPSAAGSTGLNAATVPPMTDVAPD